MPIKTFQLKIRRDRGILYLIVQAASEDRALELAMAVEGCSRSAIEEIHEQKKEN